MLEMLDREVERGEVVPEGDGGGGAGAAQGSGQGPVELDHHQLVQHLLDHHRVRTGGEVRVGADLVRSRFEHLTSD